MSLDNLMIEANKAIEQVFNSKVSKDRIKKSLEELTNNIKVLIDNI